MDNRLEELTPLERILVGDLINTIAAEPPDDLVLHRILREAQVAGRCRLCPVPSGYRIVASLRSG
jgi:hypothetical protein